MTDVLAELVADGTAHSPSRGRHLHRGVGARGDTRHADLARSYRAPVPESQKIMGMISFYNEKVDVLVDGVLQTRLHSPFS
ncbi:MAG: DUF427 domain-containing protein [Actinomycetota bacterium]|nr:DUF427 domain-containing protein [Actinomycetota bacterium]